MKVIGVTGKSGSGKSTLAKLLAYRLNGVYVDIDVVGHHAINTALPILYKKFGDKINDENGNFDRKQLGNIMFEIRKQNKHNEIDDLLWKYMKYEIDNIVIGNEKDVVLDWVLLPNSHYWLMCDYTILVTSDDNIRKERVMKRDNISEEYFNIRESACIDYTDIKATYIVKNDYNEETMNLIVNSLEKDIK